MMKNDLGFDPEALNEMKMGVMTSVFAAQQLKNMKLYSGLSDTQKAEAADLMLDVSSYELDFIFSYTAHLLDLIADIDSIDSEEPIEFSLTEIVDRGLNSMGIGYD